MSELLMELENFGGHIFGLIIFLFLDYHQYWTFSIINAFPLCIKGCVYCLATEEVVHFGFYSLWVSIAPYLVV